VNAYGTFLVDSVIADAINSQYPAEGPFPKRVTEERGVIINIASAVARPVPARCLTYGVTKSESLVAHKLTSSCCFGNHQCHGGLLGTIRHPGELRLAGCSGIGIDGGKDCKYTYTRRQELTRVRIISKLSWMLPPSFQDGHQRRKKLAKVSYSSWRIL